MNEERRKGGEERRANAKMAETDVVFTSGEAKRSRTGSDQKSRGQNFENILSKLRLRVCKKRMKYIRRRLPKKVHAVSFIRTL